MQKWVRFVPLPCLLTHVEWRLFTAFLRAESGSLSYTRACEVAALDRDNAEVKAAWEKLFTELKLTYIRSSDKHGKPTAWAPTKLGQAFLSPSFVFIGGEELLRQIEFPGESWRLKLLFPVHPYFREYAGKRARGVLQISEEGIGVDLVVYHARGPQRGELIHFTGLRLSGQRPGRNPIGFSPVFYAQGHRLKGPSQRSEFLGDFGAAAGI